MIDEVMMCEDELPHCDVFSVSLANPFIDISAGRSRLSRPGFTVHAVLICMAKIDVF